MTTDLLREARDLLDGYLETAAAYETETALRALIARIDAYLALPATQ